MVGHHLGQLILRVGLAATFLTMGLSKVLPKDQYAGEAAAALANMGVIKPTTPAATPDSDGGGTTEPTAFMQPAEPAEQPEAPPLRTNRSQPDENEVRSLTPQPEVEEGQEGEATEAEGESAQPAGPSAAGPQYRAADFPTPVELPRVYRIALMLKGAAHPAPNEDGTDRMALVPTWAADSKVPGLGMATPVVLAWVAAITEIVGGGLLLVGFMSRLWALGLVGVMLTAIWLTTIGPAMQSGNAYLGFLPNDRSIFDQVSEGPGYLLHKPAYIHEFWQLALFCMAAAVMFAGPGAISVDGVLFGGGGAEEAED